VEFCYYVIGEKISQLFFMHLAVFSLFPFTITITPFSRKKLRSGKKSELILTRLGSNLFNKIVDFFKKLPKIS
jgi:hypothetical protein